MQNIFEDEELKAIVKKIETTLQEGDKTKLSTYVEVNLLTLKYWKLVAKKTFEIKA